MSQHYSDTSRENETYALPDVETFYMSEADILGVLADNGFTVNADDEVLDADGNLADEYPYSPGAAGWYYQFCFPGCLPEGDPYGPYKTEQDAIDAMREQASDY
jgi:hypothetical protein